MLCDGAVLIEPHSPLHVGGGGGGCGGGGPFQSSWPEIERIKSSDHFSCCVRDTRPQVMYPVCAASSSNDI